MLAFSKDKVYRFTQIIKNVSKGTVRQRSENQHIVKRITII